MSILVPPSGPNTAKICFIGEAPGTHEEYSIKRYQNTPEFQGLLEAAEIGPFIGPAGKKLSMFLRHASIARSSVRFDNIWPWKLKDNDFSVLYQDPSDKKQFIPTNELDMQINALTMRLFNMPNLQIVVPLGRHPLYLLTRKVGITKWRGSILPFTLYTKEFKLIPTYHPSATLKQYGLGPVLTHDLIRIREELKVQGLNYTKREFKPVPTFEECIDYLKYILDHPELWLTIDIETIIKTKILHRIGFSSHRHEAISIPLYNPHSQKSVWPEHEETELLRYIAKVLAGPNPKNLQNCLFDKHWLEFYGFVVNNIKHDSMIAQHIIEPGLGGDKSDGVPRPLSLGFIQTIYTREPYHKDESGIGTFESDGIYNCKDCAVQHEIMEEQQKHPALIRQKEIFEEEMALLLGPLDTMIKRGVLIDVAYKEELREQYELELELIEARADVFLGEQINLRSPKQMTNLLFDKLKLTGARKRSSDEDTVKILAAKYPNVKILNYLLQHRTRSKALSTYINMKIDEDNRARCRYSPTTKFGRLSSTANMWGTGTNLQNIDRKPVIRNMFIADPGMTMVAVDLEQAELRVMAHWANCWSLIEALEDSSTDIHKEMACNMFGMSPSEITKKERDTGKRIVHLLDYGGGTDMIIQVIRKEQGLNFSRADVEIFKSRHFRKYPEILNKQKEVEGNLNKSITMKNAFGREYHFYDRPGKDRTQSALSAFPQGTIGELLDRIMTRVWREFDEPGVFELLLQTHDEFIFQVKDGIELEWIEKVKPYFDYPITINEREVRIPEAYKVGKKWGSLEEIG